MTRFKSLMIALGMSLSVFAQESPDYNPIITAVSFLNITPESRGSALGSAGAATSTDVYSQFWNPAKYPFAEEQFGVGFSYTPWLRELVDDIGLFDLTGYYRFDELQTLSASIRYFSLGEITGTDHEGRTTSTIEPNEFALDLGYSRKFSDNWGGAIAFRYIRSDLYSGAGIEGVDAGNSFAADIATYYRSNQQYLADYPVKYSFGMNVSNLGRKITYDDKNRLFLPSNLKVGAGLELEIDDYNTVMATFDINKLLVPTPSSYDSISQEQMDMGTLEGVFTSFGDASFQEEMQEIMYSVGVEYVYDQAFSVRGGYYHEHQNKGNRKIFTVGAGFKMNVFALDVSYLVPVTVTSPLANTLRFSLTFGIDGLQNLFSTE